MALFNINMLLNIPEYYSKSGIVRKDKTKIVAEYRII